MTRSDFSSVALPLAAAMMGLCALAACDDSPTTPGQALDKAIQDTGTAVKRAGEEIRDVGRRPADR